MMLRVINTTLIIGNNFHDKSNLLKLLITSKDQNNNYGWHSIQWPKSYAEVAAIHGGAAVTKSEYCVEANLVIFSDLEPYNAKDNCWKGY